MSTVYVYWIYGEQMVPLYVGITDNIDTRMRSHSQKAWWAEVRRIDSRPYATRDAALTAEKGEIKRLRPKHNTVHNMGNAPRKAPIPRVNSGGRRQLVSLADAAAHIGCNTKTIRRRISDGTLTGYRFGPRVIRVDLAELDTLLNPIPTVGTVRLAAVPT